jgi:hypothetical protein
MAKLTLLQIVQRVLSAIDSDNVASIDETPESEQIVHLTNTVYSDILDDIPWYHRREVGKLLVTSDPHIMRIPDDKDHILDLNIWYNGKQIQYIEPADMVYKFAKRDKTLPNVTDGGVVNDRDPVYWTSYDDRNIVFDAANGYLVEDLSQVLFSYMPTANLSQDLDVPDLPDRLSSVLLWGVLEEAFRTLKGDETAARAYQGKYLRAKAKAKRWARNINKKETTHGVSYGRKQVRHLNEIPSHFINEGS